MNTDYKFKLVQVQYYKKYRAFYPNYIRNKITGQNMGDHVYLQVIFYNERGELLDTPFYEEDCYEYARYTNI